MHLTSAAALAVARKIAAQHPDALVPAQVIRLPGLHATYAPAVRLRVGAEAPAGIEGVMVLEAEPEVDVGESFRPKPKVVRAPKPPEPPVERRRRVGQRDRALSLLRRPEGVTSVELAKALAVLPHTARSLLSRLGREMDLERGEDRRYRLAS